MIFGVGLSRTGTTTLGDACEQLGMTRLGWTTKVGPVDSHLLLKDWENGDIAHLTQVASRYDVLEDLPWPLVYREMAEAFPEAKFVLTRRSSASVWLPSIQEHIARTEYPMHARIYGSASAHVSPTVYLDFYERHLRDVRAFFGTDRLLEVCWEEGDGWQQLCGFLDIPAPDVPFPRSNAGPVPQRRRRPWYVRKLRKARRRVKATLASSEDGADEQVGEHHSKEA